jgi:transaldolase
MAPLSAKGKPESRRTGEEQNAMKFFVDTADIAEIKELAQTGLLDGVTTNPSLIAKTGRPIKDVIAEICAVVPGPVSAEVAATETGEMLREGRILGKIAKNVAVKVPLTWDGLKACRTLSGEGFMVNVTLCFTAAQALLAAKAGATFISPFVGRLDDIGLDGMELVRDIRVIYDNYPNLKTEILAASIRTHNNVKDAASAGADIATVPAAVLKGLVKHPLTDKGLEAFLADWKKTGQKIE